MWLLNIQEILLQMFSACGTFEVVHVHFLHPPSLPPTQTFCWAFCFYLLCSLDGNAMDL